MPEEAKPILRALDFQQVHYQGQPMWYLRDPLHLSERQLFFPQAMAPLLTLLDGQRTAADIHEAFCDAVGVELDPQITVDALDQLHDACLLDNARTQAAKEAHLVEYRAQPYRAPALAGDGYPAEAHELAAYLSGFSGAAATGSWRGRGLISPHIDYPRGGEVYAKVWGAAEQAIHEADLVIILGTDHYGGLGTITLTHQPYATPYGVLPSDNALIDKLAASWGPQEAFADELHHRQEHSVELSAVWLHHIFQRAGQAPCPMVPILVGSFQHYLMNGHKPSADARLAAFLEVLQQETSGRRVLAVASVDLAHVGPTFGDNFAMDQTRRQRLANQDQALIKAAVAGDAEEWFTRIAAVEDRNRICGFSPTYLLLRYLGRSTGTQLAYQQCPADTQDMSLVSICGLLID